MTFQVKAKHILHAQCDYITIPMKKMADSRDIEAMKIYVRFIPLHTTIEELKTFFGVCGKISFCSVIPPKTMSAHGNPCRCYGFIVYETQQEADRAVQELHGQTFVNGKGFAGRLSVTRALQLRGKKTQDKLPKEQLTLKELQQIYEENEEKLKQIYFDPAAEQELQDLKMKMNQLEVQVDELKGKVDSLKGENEIFMLKLKLQELDEEQLKLKAAR